MKIINSFMEIQVRLSQVLLLKEFRKKIFWFLEIWMFGLQRKDCRLVFQKYDY